MSHRHLEAVPAIRLSHVRFQYPAAATWALDDIDLEVRPGEIVGLVGPNDAGKTTICLVASGLAPGVTGGRIDGEASLVGQPTASLKPSDAARLCGILFQQPRSQLSGTTATTWEEIAFGPRNLGLPLDEIIERVNNVVSTLRIEHLAPRDPGRLSGGQGQLVALASVLALRPIALVLDEPTSQLDPEGTRLVGEAIRRAADDLGCAVLVVEHKTGLLATISSRVAVVDGGRLIATGAAREVLESDALPNIGVEPPPDVRLRQAGSELSDSARTRLTAAIESRTG
jgi:energy-coupling factor transport system ATP-binding protein